MNVNNNPVGTPAPQPQAPNTAPTPPVEPAAAHAEPAAPAVPVNPVAPVQPIQEAPTKFCKFCGGKIPADAVICTLCGRQVEEIAQKEMPATPNIVINNSNANTNTNTNVNKNTVGVVVAGRMKNKWVAFFLCLFLGCFGAHKFYEGKIGMGIVYLCTCGLFAIGAFIDLIKLLFKPNPYYVL